MKSRGFGRRTGFGERAAIVVVDMIRGFTDPNAPFGSPMDEALKETRYVLDAGREAGIPRYFTTVVYDDADLRDAGAWSRKVAPEAMRDLGPGSPMGELDPQLARREDEQLLVKKYASCFFGTDLASRLTHERVDTLVVVGCTTSGCVRATVVDGVQNGLRVIVPEGAVADRLQSAHDQSLFDMDQKYADVIGAEDVVRSIHAYRPAGGQDSGQLAKEE